MGRAAQGTTAKGRSDNRDHSLPQAEKEGLLEKAVAQLRAGTVDDLLVLIGYGKLTPETVGRAIYPERGEPSDLSLGQQLESVALARKAVKKSVGGVRVQGEADIVVRFAKCCNPVPGDSIVGFISVSRDRAVLVHTRECPKSLDLDPGRRLDVAWDDGVQTLRPVAVEVLSTDRPGILASISRCFTEHGVNISQAKCRTTEDGRAVNTFQVTVGHLEQLKTVLRSLGAIEGVVSATRL